MKKTLLVLGLAWASTMTMAQSDAQQKKDTKPAKQSVTTARETGSGMATGRMNVAPSNPAPAAYEQSVITAREAGSGMATGRMAQAPTGTHHDVSARETGSGMATGKTADQNSGLHQQNVIHRDLAARETGSGMATGKPMAADDWDEQQKHKNNMSGAQSNPMYNDNAREGTNPLYQGDTKSGTNPLYQSNSRATKTRSNIQNNRVAAGDVTGDGSPDVAVSADQQDSARITKSRSNIQNNRVAAGDVNGDGVAEGVVKSKSNITNNREASADKKLAPRDAATGQASGKRQHN